MWMSQYRPYGSGLHNYGRKDTLHDHHPHFNAQVQGMQGFSPYHDMLHPSHIHPTQNSMMEMSPMSSHPDQSMGHSSQSAQPSFYEEQGLPVQELHGAPSEEESIHTGEVPQHPREYPKLTDLQIKKTYKEVLKARKKIWEHERTQKGLLWTSHRIRDQEEKDRFSNVKKSELREISEEIVQGLADYVGYTHTAIKNIINKQPAGGWDGKTTIRATPFTRSRTKKYRNIFRTMHQAMQSGKSHAEASPSHQGNEGQQEDASMQHRNDANVAGSDGMPLWFHELKKNLRSTTVTAPSYSHIPQSSNVYSSGHHHNNNHHGTADYPENAIYSSSPNWFQDLKLSLGLNNNVGPDGMPLWSQNHMENLNGATFAAVQQDHSQPTYTTPSASGHHNEDEQAYPEEQIHLPPGKFYPHRQ